MAPQAGSSKLEQPFSRQLITTPSTLKRSGRLSILTHAQNAWYKVVGAASQPLAAYQPDKYNGTKACQEHAGRYAHLSNSVLKSRSWSCGGHLGPWLLNWQKCDHSSSRSQLTHAGRCRSPIRYGRASPRCISSVRILHMRAHASLNQLAGQPATSPHTHYSLG